MSSRTVLACGAAITILGLVVHIPYVVMSGAYLALGAVLARRYVRSATKHLSYCRKLEPCEAFVGDTVNLNLSVENRKPLPVFWLKCDDDVPGDRSFGSLPLTPYMPGRAALSNTVHLKWFERVERTFEVSCIKRGVFRLGPAKLTVGDPLGLETHQVVSQRTDTLTVYPRIAQLKGLPWLTKSPFGTVPVKGWVHPDPLTIAGTRPYDGRTPINQIEWKATARTGELQVRVLEPTIQSKIVVALNLSTSEHFWEGIDSPVLEDAITIAASVCSAMLEQGVAFGLVSNSIGVGKGPLFIGPGSSERHLKRILESLAHVTLPWLSFSGTLKQLRYRISKDTGVLAIMPHISQADCEHLSALANAGYPVTIILMRPPQACCEAYRAIAGHIPAYLRLDPAGREAGEVIVFERIG